MVRVKICGITNVDDALAALSYGADFLGFILYPPSPRAVAPDAVAAITAQVRAQRADLFARIAPPRLVGVFVNEPAAAMAETLARCGLDFAQLSGDEDANLVTEPSSPIFGRSYKAIRPKALEAARGDATRYTKNIPDKSIIAPRLLLDTPHQALYGGTGQISDWGLAAELSIACPGLMLAGGLNPGNVVEAVRRTQPFAVDVAGGVEAVPGRKDHALLRDFITKAKIN